MDQTDDEQTINALQKMASERIKFQIRQPSDTPRIRNLSISLTMLCNQGCQHCWVDASHAMKNELTTSEILDVLMQARELGAEHVKLTGGEVFTRKDINTLIKHSLEYGLRVSVETNGLLLKKEHLQEFVDSKEQLQFFISLDGFKPNTHDRFRKSPGAYDKTIQTIKQLSEQDFRFSIHTVANKINLHEIIPLYNYMCKLGAKQHKVILSIHRLGRGRQIQDISLNVEDIIWLVNNLDEVNFWDYRWKTQKDPKTVLMLTLPPAFQPLNNLNSFTCGWAIDFCSILADGSVAMCHGSYEQEMAIAGNIREVSLESLWKSSEFFVSARHTEPKSLKGICGNCIVSPACRGLCRTSAIAEYGEFLAPYPFCQEMYERGYFPKYMLVDSNKDSTYVALPRSNGRAIQPTVDIKDITLIKKQLHE
ncbi:radical SAM/SPASM domain-containing protein [Candidatus Leptofilum sp.]|uniref:radical SAM/SPASM domain-containing protein n=1 Tax=Candidatus Leptofilum sp. TaxID=3241576 RepID=UPI003B58B91F